MVRSKKPCKILTADKALRELTAPACKDWDKHAKQKTRLGAKTVTVVDYVKLIPKYPITPEDYARCIQKWMNCHSLATTMNNRLEDEIRLQEQIARVEKYPPSPYRDQYLAFLRTSLATLQTQQSVDVGILSSLCDAYEDCMTGTPV
jgi:hypothetical protein